MNIELEQISPTDALIKITLNEADYQPEVEKKIKQYSKQIQLKGFRPGKVPPAIIKRMYGKSVLVEEINHILSQNIVDFIKSNDLNVVGDPLPEESILAEIDWDQQKDFNFIYKIGVVPEFQLDIQNVMVTSYEVHQDTEQIEEIIGNIRKQFGNTVHPDTSEAGDFLYGDLKQLLANTSENVPSEAPQIEEAEKIPFQQAILLPLNQVSDSVVDRFIGIQKDDVVQVEIQELFKSGPKGINLATGISLEEAEDLQGLFEFKLDNITRTEPAEMNEELFQKVFREEEITDEAAFREKVKTALGANFQRDIDYLLDRQIREEIIKQTEIQLPNEFLKDWLASINEGKFTREQIENEYDDFVDGLKWDLITSKLTKEYEVEATYQEVQEEARNLIMSQFGGYLPQDSEIVQRLQGIVNNYLTMENGKNYHRIHKDVMEDKLFNILRDKVEKTILQVSAEEFEEIMRE